MGLLLNLFLSWHADTLIYLSPYIKYSIARDWNVVTIAKRHAKTVYVISL